MSAGRPGGRSAKSRPGMGCSEEEAAAACRDYDIWNGSEVALDDVAEQHDRSGGRMICLGTGRRLLGRRGPNGEAVRMPDVMQVQGRVKDAFEGHHGEQEHEDDGERA